ncbi:DUF465 domain-containing protein [Pseudomonas rubra]|uniref:DUF465 domain-containing protein n=1 Tax=Pseudomonas rubra TaxID=2942627 RepID=A0ABT5P3U7_9PSED|nr:DUF465 domain-containing protein [Pseudomonas rubra]MDD1012783.1 DUF465 domain-containing protein [Pseudomonas rubra]MDD1037056.1 DUF465 domain-containing protein [Pseudomonas rubra]MDD1156974.1 DUF465 domain-containing protein [Pseudomonas rubra]
MPVKHDLLADLGLDEKAFNDKKKADAQLSRLHDKYNDIDTRVLEAERGSASDDQVNKLRLERVQIKDEIVAHLK